MAGPEEIMKESIEPKRKRILVVDDQAANLSVMRQILKDEYELAFAKSGEAALLTMSKSIPDLVLLDVMMPGMDGHSVKQKMAEDITLAKIPVIFCTAMSDAGDEARGLELGAADYITKPVVPAVVKLRVSNQLALADQRWSFDQQVREANKALLESRLRYLQMLGYVAEIKDKPAGFHVNRVAHYSRMLAEAAGLAPDFCELIFSAAATHDIGKAGIPDHILKKPASLDHEERRIMETHTQIGADIIASFGDSSPIFTMARAIALGHHEKWDGSGYPQGLSGESIPIEARIVAIADVFDAFTSRRPYEEAGGIEHALELIQEGSGGHFDPTLVSLFLAQRDNIEAIRCEWNDN